MISKNQIKFIHTLETKKGRTKEGTFVAEGPKVVADLMEVYAPLMIFATEKWLSDTKIPEGCRCTCVTEEELRKVSFLQHPQQVLAVFPIPGRENGGDNTVSDTNSTTNNVNEISNTELYLALDGVQDPGNLGTIIRIADWFGVERIFCSCDTADAYNPKVVQATMGSIARVKVEYVDLQAFLSALPTDYPVYGTFLDGEDIYKKQLTKNGIVVMGNEGKGVSTGVAKLINNRLLIPNFPKGRKTADSLNVAIATAITCSEFRR